jgi:hypothetical protein
MRKIACVAGLVVLTLLAVSGGFAQGSKASKSGAGTIVIVFKDGHRQTYNLSDIERVEFPGAAARAASDDSAPAPAGAPPRGHFMGKWEVGDGNGSTFYITLKETGDAYRSLGGVHGKWAYVNGEARVTWDDGAQDAIRKVGGRDQKFAYRAGKAFTDEPDNVTDAHNTSPRPI